MNWWGLRRRPRMGREAGAMQDWQKFGGMPPPPPARRRRAVGPERHEPPVTIAEMLATYRAVAPRCSPLFRAVLCDIMARCVEGQRDLLRDVGEEG